ncbi:MAG: flagellin [candidate division KSB1 bacterium]|nr:flagellin [candidate division KSB1 bacterium]
MSLRIMHNIAAMNAHRQLLISDSMLSKSLERLSSGYRVNRAADDAAGLAISQRMRAKIVGLQQASRNASQAVNLVQTAEGAMNEIHNMLTRMRELAVQAASDSVSDTDREAINAEFEALRNEIDRIASVTEYNGAKLIDGSYQGNTVSTASSAYTVDSVVKITLTGAADGTYTFADATGNTISLTNGTVTETVTLSSAPATGTTTVLNFSTLGVQVEINWLYNDRELDGKTIIVQSGSGGVFQVGADNTGANRISFSIGDLKATGSNLNLSGVTLATRSGAQSAIDAIDAAITYVNEARGDLGAVQNRLTYTIANVNNAVENLQASESTIRDADFAEEITQFTRAQILVQAGTAMLAQANVAPQAVLQLLG